jgi:hypothetical protein
MDTKLLIAEAKARFNHNSTKSYLKEKYQAKLILADQGGLWRANLETINFLRATKTKEIILIDTFENPVKVNRIELLEKLTELYHSVMNEWHNEYKELENKR